MANVIRKGQEREDVLTELIEWANALPVAKVVEDCGVPLGRRSGRHFMPLCPFHMDNRPGSFIITPDINMWKCFACPPDENGKAGGGPIRFVMKFEQIGFLEAVFLLARRYGKISEEEFRRYSRRRWNEDSVRKIRARVEADRKEAKPRTAPPDVSACVYAAMPKVCGLSKAHERHLRQVRGVTDLSDYFTFPTRRKDLPRAIAIYVAEKIAAEQFGIPFRELPQDGRERIAKAVDRLLAELKYVPGFYEDRDKKTTFCSYTGIGFVVRNEEGKPAGICVRKDRGMPRYVWFSSSFAANDPECEGGSSPGAPGGVIFPKPEHIRRTPCVCVTEGRFKAEQIALKGNTAVYVSGVSSWKNVVPMVKKLAKDKKVFLMFDSDAMGNTAVFGQLEAFCRELEKDGFECPVILWRKEYGKGFDDLCLAKGDGYRRLLSCRPFAAYKKVYETCLKDVIASFGAKKLTEVGTQNADEFVKRLQAAVEDALDLPRD